MSKATNQKDLKMSKKTERQWLKERRVTDAKEREALIKRGLGIVNDIKCAAIAIGRNPDIYRKLVDGGITYEDLLLADGYMRSVGSTGEHTSLKTLVTYFNIDTTAYLSLGTSYVIGIIYRAIQLGSTHKRQCAVAGTTDEELSLDIPDTETTNDAPSWSTTYKRAVKTVNQMSELDRLFADRYKKNVLHIYYLLLDNNERARTDKLVNILYQRFGGMPSFELLGSNGYRLDSVIPEEVLRLATVFGTMDDTCKC